MKGGRDPRPCVGHIEAEKGVLAVGAHIEPEAAGRGRVAQGLVGVRHQVHHNLLQLVMICRKRREIVGKLQLQLDVICPQGIDEQVDGVFHDFVQIGGSALWGVPSCTCATLI